jgi:hypothetical protein
MNDDDRLRGLLRSALAAPPVDRPVRDLWPDVVERMRRPQAWTWIDMAVAAVVASALLLFPESLLLLSYHL